MAGFTGTLTAQVVALLTSATSGVNARIVAMEAEDSTLQVVRIRSIVTQNVSAEIAEVSGQAEYPSLLVYCDNVQNMMKEKSRDFSGRINLVIEVRQTQETLKVIESNTEMYVDAVCALLSDSRGSWGDGASYSGAYRVDYEPVVFGGKNFLQRAKVNFALDLSE
jgi:hypothetical protein